jgi:lysophospholipase L1-like esterase
MSRDRSMIPEPKTPEQPSGIGRKALKAVAVGAGVTTATAFAATGVLIGQARQARRSIPIAQSPPPRCDGIYGAKFTGEPISLVLLGDSTAAGYGAHRPRETPGALLATGISRRLQRPVRLRRFAMVGARSADLAPQVEAALEHRPDLAIILIGGNDVTHRTPISVAVRHLARAVRALRAAGAEVVVGTCPDLGTIRPIKPPLRWLARQWSRQLAAAQTMAVVEAGGWTVSLGDLLGPRFAAEPVRLFAWDRFHPSADGYAVAVAAMLPTVLAALGAAEEKPTVLHENVRSLSRAAHEAVRHAGTEVSGAGVDVRNRLGRRWARLRRLRPWFTQARAGEPDTELPASSVPQQRQGGGRSATMEGSA